MLLINYFFPHRRKKTQSWRLKAKHSGWLTAVHTVSTLIICRGKFHVKCVGRRWHVLSKFGIPIGKYFTIMNHWNWFIFVTMSFTFWWWKTQNTNYALNVWHNLCTRQYAHILFKHIISIINRTTDFQIDLRGAYFTLFFIIYLPTALLPYDMMFQISNVVANSFIVRLQRLIVRLLLFHKFHNVLASALYK